MRNYLRTIGSILLYFAIAGGIVYCLYALDLFPAGEHTWESLYCADFWYQSIADGNIFPLYDRYTGNGAEILRFSEPLGTALLLLCEAAGALAGASGQLYFAYALYAGALYFLSAILWYALGAKTGRRLCGFLIGLVWPFLPAGFEMFFSEGQLGMSLLLCFLPVFVYELYRYAEEAKDRSAVGVTLLFFLIVLCDISYAAYVAAAAVCYLLFTCILRGVWKRAVVIVPAFAIGYLLNGAWLFAYLMNYDSGAEENTELWQSALSSLNPFSMSEDGAAWYLGLAVFGVMLLGAVFSHKNIMPIFWTALLLFLFSTKFFSPATSLLPVIGGARASLLFPVAGTFAAVGFLLWKSLRGKFLTAAGALAAFDVAVTVVGFSGMSDGMRAEYDMFANNAVIVRACDAATQRIAFFSDDKEQTMLAQKLASSDGGIVLTQTVTDGGSSLASNVAVLEQALSGGNYLYVFDRCLELGDDTVVIKKELLAEGKLDTASVTTAAEKLGYLLKGEDDTYLWYFTETDGTYGVSSGYQSIGIGEGVSELAILYPSIEETSDSNLNHYTYEELSRYESVYIASFTYDDKTAAEELVLKLSQNGVKVVIEAGGIPADIVTKNNEFLGVTCNDITFENGYPVLYTDDGEYDCNLFAAGYDDWQTVYLTGLDTIKGYFYENQEQIAFLGMVDNDNLVFVGLNLGYHYSLTKDPNVEEIYDGLLDLVDGLLPSRELIPLTVTYGENEITIEAEDSVNTGLASLDAFVSEQGTEKKNHFVYADGGTTVITMEMPYVTAGLWISFAGLVFAVPYCAAMGRKENA